MNILISGATGFVGRHLVPVLQQGGNKLICIVRDKKKAVELFGDVDISYVHIEHLDEIEKYAPECVIHLAAYLSSKDDLGTLERLLDANIRFGTLLLDSLKRCKSLKLFVNFGTFAEYRYGPMEINNAYLYSATKTAFKQLLKYYSDLNHYKYINIIPYTIYG